MSPPDIPSPVACRSCGNADLQQVLSLGHTPLANALLTTEQLADDEETFPLDLAFCPQCTLVQITETVSPEKLFREYFYLSSFSDTMLRHAADIAARMIEERGLGPNNLVVEIASNDGYLLRHYKNAGVRVLGIEPARNIARVAQEEHGIPTIPEFFVEFLARMLRLSDFDPDVVHANNVLAHVGDLNDFVFGLGILLKIDGVAVIEVPYVKDMIDACEFDTVYHEHLSYFSLTALNELFNRNMLTIWRVHDFGALLREAWERGIVLFGVSAGMLCWFEAACTDSFGLQLEGIRDGLGFLSGSACPHYDGEERRRPRYRALIDGGFPAGIAAEDGVGLHYVGTELREVVTCRPGATAFRVTRDGEERLEARELTS